MGRSYLARSLTRVRMMTLGYSRLRKQNYLQITRALMKLCRTKTYTYKRVTILKLVIIHSVGFLYPQYRHLTLRKSISFFSPGATTPIGGCILQSSSGL